jgi:hypothetical protein
MPVRVYDISKKLGLENKEILMKAKALGIAAAKVPSSSLDKVTAEFLEDHLRADHPELISPAPLPSNQATVKTPPQPANEQSVNLASAGFREEESLAIRLRTCLESGERFSDNVIVLL